MSAATTKNPISVHRLLALTTAAAALLLTAVAHAAAPGITGVVTGSGPTFDLAAQPAYLSQPDGQMV